MRIPANNQKFYDLILLEATADGVRSYPLRRRLYQWSIICPQIVVRRLKLRNGYKKTGIFYRRANEFFVKKLMVLDYGIWANLFQFRSVGSSDKSKQTFFCSQLICEFFKDMNFLPNNTKSHRVLPADFGEKVPSTMLPFNKYCNFGPQLLLLFKEPAVSKAKRQGNHHSAMYSKRSLTQTSGSKKRSRGYSGIGRTPSVQSRSRSMVRSMSRIDIEVSIERKSFLTNSLPPLLPNVPLPGVTSSNHNIKQGRSFSVTPSLDDIILPEKRTLSSRDFDEIIESKS